MSVIPKEYILPLSNNQHRNHLALLNTLNLNSGPENSTEITLEINDELDIPIQIMQTNLNYIYDI